MYKKSLANEISISELKQYRQEGLTNKQIAQRVGCCPATIARYLGKQPAGLRAPYGSEKAIVKSVEETPITILPSRNTSLSLVSETKIMDGKYHQYTINSFGNISIVSKCQDQKLQLNQRGMEEYLTELMDAYSVLCDCCQK